MEGIKNTIQRLRASLHQKKAKQCAGIDLAVSYETLPIDMIPAN